MENLNFKFIIMTLKGGAGMLKYNEWTFFFWFSLYKFSLEKSKQVFLYIMYMYPS